MALGNKGRAQYKTTLCMMILKRDFLERNLSGFARLAFYVALFQVLMVVYWPALNAPFVYDDILNVVYNADLRQPREFWRVILPHPTSMQFDQRPLAGLLSLLNYQVCGLSPVGFRLVNLFIHWATAIILCEFVIAFARALGLRAGSLAAIAVTTLWALHPLNSVTVIFVSQRMESMMSFFYLLTLWSVLKAREATRPGRYLAGSIASFIACLASKEVGLTLLLAIPFLLAIVSSPKWWQSLRERASYLSIIALIWILFVGWWATGPRIEEVEGGVLDHPWVYFKAQCAFVVHYLRLVFWPDPLAFTYASAYPDAWSKWLPHAAILIFGIAVVWLASARRRWLLFPGLMFFVILAPTSSFLPIPREPAAEWRMHLPSACVVALAFLLANHIAIGYSRGRNVLISLLLGVALLFGAISSNRATVFQNPVTLWSDNLEKQPGNYKAMANLSMARIAAGQHEQARVDASGLVAYGEQVNAPGVQALGWQILGMAAADAGQYEEALKSYQRALILDERLDALQAQVSQALMELGQFALAAEHGRKALMINPDDPFSVLIATDAFWRAGLTSDALALFERAGKICQDLPTFHAVRTRLSQPLPQEK